MLKRYFLALATACLPHLIFTENQSSLVQNHYPNAYAWYITVSEKYPDAKLQTIKFCICDHHHAKNHAIYFPKSSLEFINDWHNSPYQTPEVTEKLAEEEYLLLHEAAHALNYDYEKNEFLKLIVTSTGTINLLKTIFQATQETITLQDACIKSSMTIATAAAVLLGYTRFQEKNADQFANQNADQQTLTAGIAWHKQNKTDLNISQDSSKTKQFLTEHASDLTHPRPTKRQERAQNSYHERFELVS